VLRRWGGFMLGIPTGAVLLFWVDYLAYSIKAHQSYDYGSTSDWKKPRS